MENTSYIALSRQAALWRQMEIVANNIANANTPAFKGEQVMFKEFLVDTKSDNRELGKNVAFVQDKGVLRDTREGPLTKTDNPLDVALHGDGYFVIDTPEGFRFTRQGHFRLDEAGMLVNSEGLAVMQTNDQPIIFAPNESRVEINRDGTVSTENGVVGKLRVVNFENEQLLKKVGNGLYNTSALPTDVERVEVHQGMMEESNVQPVVEMTKMIEILRNYQGVQQMVDKDHERRMKAIETIGRPTT